MGYSKNHGVFLLITTIFWMPMEIHHSWIPWNPIKSLWITSKITIDSHDPHDLWNLHVSLAEAAPEARRPAACSAHGAAGALDGHGCGVPRLLFGCLPDGPSRTFWKEGDVWGCLGYNLLSFGGVFDLFCTFSDSGHGAVVWLLNDSCMMHRRLISQINEMVLSKVDYTMWGPQDS